MKDSAALSLVPPRRRAGRTALLLVAATLGLCALRPSPAAAQNQGFAINRYEPTSAGEWSFMVDHPWYSSTRYFAGGITLNYAHNPLVYGLQSNATGFVASQSIIAHQLIGHVDLAGSFLDRVQIAASLPVILLERGDAVASAGLAPVDGVAVGDPRVGLKVRLYGQPNREAFSISLGGDVWIPLRKFDSGLPPLTSDTEVRALPKVMLGGISHRVLWSFTAGFLYRADATLASFPVPNGSTTGMALQFGAALGYADLEHRFVVGAEALLSTQVKSAFQSDFTSLEVLAGAHYNIAGQVQLGLAGGVGVLREPGTPDGRVLFRLAYAPIRDARQANRDSDGDGILDRVDACPNEAGVATQDKRTNGCPPPDRDRDGVIDADDLCPDVPRGDLPDPARLGCPIPDRDRDGVLDADDQCPTEPAGEHPDPTRRGCPDKDSDGDGLYNAQDQCPTERQGEHPDPARPGCPDKDSDGDGVYDAQDKCKTVSAGMHPDPDQLGCPLPDRDNDSVPDRTDACPTRPGAPDPDPKKNGCPGLVQIRNGQIVILRPVFFANDKDTILKNSFQVLQSVANALVAQPRIRKIAVEGHTDNRGDDAHNTSLSERRALSVMRFLIEAGIAPARLEAHGYGPTRPIGDNSTLYGRAKNRRVEFHILDTDSNAVPEPPEPMPAGETAAPPSAPEVEPPPASLNPAAGSDDGAIKKGRHKKRDKGEAAPAKKREGKRRKQG